MNVQAFRCPLCYEVFRSPISLLCGHTFCLNCLEERVPNTASSGGNGVPMMEEDESVVPDVVPTLAGSLSSSGSLPAVGQCPICSRPVPPRDQWFKNVAIEAAIAEVGRVCTNTIPFEEIQLGQLIAQTNSMEMYTATWSGKKVAVKRYNTTSVSEHERNRQITEFNLMRSLRHENILGFLGIVEDPLCLVTEYMANRNLRQFIAETQPLTMPNLVKILKDVCCGMAYLHSQNILHRNLKCENILVDSHGTCKIADFTRSSLSISIQSGGRSGLDFAHVPWMSPERLKGERYGPPADVYSFGIVLWELVTSDQPFSSYSDPFQLLMAVTQGTRPPIPPNCPAFVTEIMSACWKGPQNERPTFKQLVATLENIQL